MFQIPKFAKQKSMETGEKAELTLMLFPLNSGQDSRLLTAGQEEARERNQTLFWQRPLNQNSRPCA